MQGIVRVNILVIVVLLYLFTAGCLQHRNDRELTVSAAISLKDAMKDLGDEFQKKHPDVVLYFNFGASGTVAKQIEQGAPVDIFASASQKEMDRLEEKGLIVKETRTNFTGNKLVIVAPTGLTFEDLKSNEVKKIAIGNPGIVPAGRYAVAFMKNAGIYETLKPKFIYAGNVRQVLDYVELGEVDAGFVYSSDTLKTDMAVSVINDSMYPPIVYPVAVIQDSKKKEISEQFIEYILSDEGQTILRRYGFKYSILRK